jgi:dextranase
LIYHFACFHLNSDSFIFDHADNEKPGARESGFIPLYFQEFKTMTGNWKLLFLVLFLAVISCRKDPVANNGEPVPENPAAPAFYNLTLETDKACYSPGDAIAFTLSGQINFPVRVRCKYLNSSVSDVILTGTEWTWIAPTDDFRGYSVEVYDTVDNKEVIYAAAAVDVSSDWTKFPRYGFLSSYGVIGEEKIQQVISDLNRFHINGLQFYDWHNKHHKPLPLAGGVPASSWKDIGNRSTYFSTVKNYIEAAHNRNMKSHVLQPALRCLG